jgi:hypothetical protein
MKVKFLHPRCTYEHLGFIPDWLHDANPAPAKEQLHACYGHGGGWSPFNGFKLGADDSLNYPGDPPQKPFAEISFDDPERTERVLMYEHSWVAIIQADRSFEVCRMD